MIILNTTRNELKLKWKQMYQLRKKFSPTGVMPSNMNYGYFTGKMEYTAWLLINAQSQPVNATSNAEKSTEDNQPTTLQSFLDAFAKWVADAYADQENGLEAFDSYDTMIAAWDKVASQNAGKTSEIIEGIQ